jgi:peptide/nickel transport system permease protein
VITFIIRRILSAIPLLLGLLTVTFFIIHLAPGDPTSFYLQSSVDPKYGEHLRQALGLDKPLIVQYGIWLTGMVQGEFGLSFSKHQPVLRILKQTIPNTLLLTMVAFLFNFFLGICIGIITAVKRGTHIDRLVNFSALFVYSMPEFWLALMLILGVSLLAPAFPTSGLHAPLAEYLSPWDYAIDTVRHLLLPVFVLGIASAAATGKYMRGSLLDVLNQDYIRTARAKGLSETAVVLKHGLRNALIPIVTVFGLSFPFLLGGAVIVESVFGIPGMGKLVIDAIFMRDYPLIIACTFVSGLMVILGNLIADVLLVVVDPRIRI